MSSQYEKFLPTPSTLTTPFWEYCKKHELRMQFCSTCGEWIWYPKAWCPTCASRNLEWKLVSGRGTVYSFTVIRQVIDNSPAFQSDLPFVIALIELEEGPRIYSNLKQAPEDTSIGQKVQVYFDDVTGSFTLPKFKVV